MIGRNSRNKFVFSQQSTSIYLAMAKRDSFCFLELGFPSLGAFVVEAAALDGMGSGLRAFKKVMVSCLLPRI